MLEVFALVDGGRNGFAESVDVWKVVAAGIANDIRRLASVLKGSYSIDQITYPRQFVAYAKVLTRAIEDWAHRFRGASIFVEKVLDTGVVGGLL